MQEVVRLQNPRAMLMPEMQDLFRKAFAKSPSLKGNVDAAFPDIAVMIADPRFCFLVGMEDGKYKALTIIGLPTGGVTPMAQVLVGYNGGSTLLKDMVIDEAKAYLKATGNDRFWAVNITGATDAAWSKSFKRMGKSKKIGSIMEFSVGD